jgi:hypothetical protein
MHQDIADSLNNNPSKPLDLANISDEIFPFLSYRPHMHTDFQLTIQCAAGDLQRRCSAKQLHIELLAHNASKSKKAHEKCMKQANVHCRWHNDPLLHTHYTETQA